MKFKKFEDLQFKVEEFRYDFSHIHVERANLFFPNGYGCSVIRGTYSCGDEGLYKLAVLKGSEENYYFCYDTCITDDFISHLSPEQVTKIMYRIQRLKKK